MTKHLNATIYIKDPYPLRRQDRLAMTDAIRQVYGVEIMGSLPIRSATNHVEVCEVHGGRVRAILAAADAIATVHRMYARLWGYTTAHAELEVVVSFTGDIPEWAVEVRS